MRKVRMQRSGLLLCLFLIGFIFGIIFVNLQWRVRRTDIDGLNLFFLGGQSGSSGGDSGMSIGINTAKKEYLLYLLGMRLRLPVGLCIAGMLTVGMILVYCVTLWYGFLAGMLLSAGLLSMGVKGMLLLLLSFLLPLVLYAPALLYLLGQVLDMSEKISMGSIYQMKEYGRYLFRCFLGILLLAAGCIVECYVNPYVMKLAASLM